MLFADINSISRFTSLYIYIIVKAYLIFTYFIFLLWAMRHDVLIQLISPFEARVAKHIHTYGRGYVWFTHKKQRAQKEEGRETQEMQKEGKGTMSVSIFFDLKEFIKK